eukprot:jgi/Orpsp1_1/1187566/evm.model.d7180000058655.1
MLELVNLSKVVFDKYDVDKSGTITYDEFKSMAYDLGHFLSDIELKLAVSQIDRRGIGKITYVDFKEWWKNSDRWTKIKLSDENFKYLYDISAQFQTYDKDKNGSIDKKEFKNFWKGINKKKTLSSIEERKMFEKLDSNGDGVISFNE